MNKLVAFNTMRLYLLVLLLSTPSSKPSWMCTRINPIVQPHSTCLPKLDESDAILVELKTDALAEWKYRYTCDDQSDTNAAHIKMWPAPSNCDTGGSNEGSKLPGVLQLAKGYNIVTDSHSDVKVLDLESGLLRNATVSDPVTKTCFTVPDAISASSPQGVVSVGVTFTAYVPMIVYKAIGAGNVREYKEKVLKRRWLELSLWEPEYKVALKAGLTDSKNVLRMQEKREHLTREREAEDGSVRDDRLDFSEAFYGASAVQLYVLNPIPTKELMLRWGDLLKKIKAKITDEIDKEFDAYFHDIGTHYYESAAIGNYCDFQFTVTTPDEFPVRSDSQLRANCGAAQASVEAFGMSLNAVANKSCQAAHLGATELEALDYRPTEFETSCDRFISQKGNNFRQWLPGDMIKKTYEINHVNLDRPHDDFDLFGGRKLWIPKLVETVLLNSDREEYKSLIAKLDDGDFQHNRARLQEFQVVLTRQLKSYLSRSVPQPSV